jgi:tetratricopeptide (TPR) repeat protein
MSRRKNIGLLAAVLAALAFIGYLVHAYLDLEIERAGTPTEKESGTEPEDRGRGTADAWTDTAPGEAAGERTIDLLAKERELAAAGRSGEACALLRGTMYAKKNEPDAWLFLGYCMLAGGDPKQAAEAFTQASLRGGAKGDELVIGLAESFRRQGKIKTALKYYEIYSREHPDGPHARLAEKYGKKLSRFLKASGKDACENGLCEPEELGFPAGEP